MYIRTGKRAGQLSDVEAGRWVAAGIGLGQGPGALPRITNVDFVNSGQTDRDNCCAKCPVNLGVGIDRGAGQTASNGMELRFTVSGHREGIWYDVLRTRRSSLWERTGGTWKCLDFAPSGTFDDHGKDDECLIPRNGKIFVEDRPGWKTVLPAPHGIRWGTRPGVVADVNATEVVARSSFAEWVNAKSQREGIDWTPIYKYVFWNSVIWLTRDAYSRWVLDGGRSRIERGSISEADLKAAPT
jgi:hypothetical protein